MSFRPFICIFALMNEKLPQVEWSENVILADADYIDKVAFDLIVNFERMIGRRIPPADMARWIDCVALDGGVKPTENPSVMPSTHVILTYQKGKKAMENFIPASFENELNGKAFQDSLGEFLISTIPSETTISKEDLFLEILGTVCAQKECKRIMVIPNTEEGTLYDEVREVLRHLDDDKRITVFAMQPLQGGNSHQEILGYSLMSALGIRSEEIHEQ